MPLFCALGVWAGRVVQGEEDGVKLEGGRTVGAMGRSMDETPIAWRLKINGAHTVGPAVRGELVGQQWHCRRV